MLYLNHALRAVLAALTMIAVGAVLWFFVGVVSGTLGFQTPSFVLISTGLIALTAASGRWLFFRPEHRSKLGVSCRHCRRLGQFVVCVAVHFRSLDYQPWSDVWRLNARLTRSCRGSIQAGAMRPSHRHRHLVSRLVIQVPVVVGSK
jgi:hypothetical protein